MEYYFERYGDIELQRRMVSDRWRTEAFAKAIAEVVKEGDHVLDVGTGTGLLAMLSAKAGAAKVTGIDQSDVIEVAAKLVKANGLKPPVTLLRGPAAELELPEKVDLLVSEWLGHFAFVEAMLDDVIAARDKNLKPDGVMLPSSVQLKLAGLDDSVLYHQHGPGYWRTSVQGLDYSMLEFRELKQGRAPPTRIEEATICTSTAELLDLDLKTAKKDDPFIEGSVEIEAVRDCALSGFAGWFVAPLSPSVVLDTGPHCPETHWSQTYLPFFPRTLNKGDKLSVQFEIGRDASEPRHLNLRLKIDDDEVIYTLE